MADIEIRVYHSPTAVVQVSFESRVCLETDPRLVKIDVCLRFKHTNLRMDRVGEVLEYTTHRTIGRSNVCFDFGGNESIRLSTAANLSDKFRRWLPELIPSDCDRVSQDIVHYARQVALNHREGGAIVVRACIEADKETHINMGLNLQDFSSYTVSPSELPRSLNLGEINALKQETFESTGNDQESSSVCSICLEEFLAGVKIIQLHCYHIFHHSCIAPWLEKQAASCPLCRLNIIKARTRRSKLLVLDDTLILTTLGTRIVIPITV